MRIIVSTHQGQLYNEEVDYVVVKNADGEFAILKNHVPIVCVVPVGYIKMVLSKQELFLALDNAMLEFKDNVLQVIAQGAFIGKDKDSARAHLSEIKQERIDANKKQNMDFTQKEKELLENMKKTKAGNL